MRGNGYVACPRLAARQINGITRQHRAARRQVLAARLQDAIGIDDQITRHAQTAVGLHAGAQQAAAGHFASGNMGVANGGDGTCVVQQATHRQLLIAARIQQARVVQVCADARRQVRAGAERALLVQQAGRIQTQGVRLQYAARVVDMHAANLQVFCGRHHAIGIVQLPLAGNIRRGSGCNAALAVVQHAGLHLQAAIAGDVATRIVQGLRHVHAHLSRSRLLQGAVTIFQLAGLHCYLLPGGDGMAVIDCFRLDIDQAIARYLAPFVIKARRLNTQAARARVFNAAVAVKHLVGMQCQLGAVDGDASARVVQGAALQSRVAITRLNQGAAAVVERSRLDIQLARAQGAAHVRQDLAAVGRRHGQQAGRRYQCAVGNDVASAGMQIDGRAARLAAAQVNGGSVQAGLAGGQVLAMGSDRLRGRQLQLTAVGQAAVGAEAGAQQAAGGAVDAAGVNAVVALRSDHTAVVDGAAHLQRLAAGRVQVAAVQYLASLGGKISTGKHAARRIIQFCHGQAGIACQRLDLAARIVDVATVESQLAASGQGRLRVVQRAC
ncbi:hypothetical protein D3C87_667920 [compost metagenome]